MKSENSMSSRNNKRKKCVIFMLIIIALIIISIFYVVNNNKKDHLDGIWSVDDITFFEFDGKGNGKLKVPTDEYKFTYIIHNNKVYLNYESNNATDSDYEYSFDGSNLVLKGINATTGTYTLTKQ